MFRSHLPRSFRSLLFLAALSLGGAAAHAQEVAQAAGPDAPAQVAPAREVSKEAAPPDELAAVERFGSPGARVDYSNPVSVALRRGFQFESGDSVARFGVPTIEPPSTSSFIADAHADSFRQDPQDPQGAA